ncbi:uncharacterized protein LOC143028504 [Oratosquilla oratoria]|uniref:uncharacterized protein LOC143028504 n=1 Tax=Oratosquilla oratoria TaxID=337810 RepID=UPI003F76AD11
MSMLAEPKRRVKWTLNPRGNYWSDDDNKFGQKLMEKMGWSKGKGLGKDEQGRTDHVKVSVRENNKGVGYKGNDDEWIKHYDAFENVLANLNNANNSDDETKPSDSMEDSASKRTSLEVKSKKSKARVHYHKFTRGKDLSRYGEDDLACILGSKLSKAQKAEPEAEEAPQELAAEEVEDEVGHTEHTHGVTTIKGGNIQEYFAKKMALLKKTKNHSKTMNNSYSEIEENEDYERPSFGGFNSGIDVANNGHGWNLEQSENHGRKRKNEEYGEMDRNCHAEGMPAVDKEEEHTHIKKKKKRAKENFETVPSKGDENGDIKEDISFVSKKKKKKKNKDVDCEQLVDNGHTEEIGKAPKKKKNKNKDKLKEDQQGEMYNEVSLDKENHKELKRKKKKKVKISSEQELALQDNQEPVFTKKKKIKSQDLNIEQDLNIIGVQDKGEEELGQSKKKKKKKKKDHDTKVVLEGGE